MCEKHEKYKVETKNQERKLIDPNEILKLVFATIVGISGYFFVSAVELDVKNSSLEIQKTKLRMSMAERLPEFQPLVKIHYTNLLTEECVLSAKVYIEILSKYQIKIRKPDIYLYDLNSGKHISKSKYTVLNKDQFWGTFSPKTKYFVEYNIKLEPGIDKENTGISINYDMETGEVEKQILAAIYKGDSEFSSLVDIATKKPYGYAEKVYLENDNWNKFESNPK